MDSVLIRFVLAGGKDPFIVEDNSVMIKRWGLTAAIIMIAVSAFYKSEPNNEPTEAKNDMIQTESIKAHKSMPAGRQVEEKQKKLVYKLNERQYDENVYDNETMERILSYIENYPKDSETQPSIEGELFREWQRQSAIFYIDTLDENDSVILINDYLRQHGINKTIPDSITYFNGQSFIKYYRDDKSKKAAFVASISNPKRIYCCIAYTEDFKIEGSLSYDLDQNGRLLSERFSDNQGGQTASISYTYDVNVPFPIITEYSNSMRERGGFYQDVYLNAGQRFWVDDRLLEFDENHRWVKYKGDIYGDFYPGEGIESYNVPVYNEEGRLDRIVENLRGSRYQDNPDEWIEDGEIEFKYSSSGRLAEVDYSGFSGNHGSSGNSGSIFYDEIGRVMYIDTFHSSGNYYYFYLYENKERYPFAIVSMGGMPYSSDEFEGYKMYFGMDFDVWLLLAHDT